MLTGAATTSPRCVNASSRDAAALSFDAIFHRGRHDTNAPLSCDHTAVPALAQITAIATAPASAPAIARREPLRASTPVASTPIIAGTGTTHATRHSTDSPADGPTWRS